MVDMTVQIKALTTPENDCDGFKWHRAIGIVFFILIINLPAISGLFFENDIEILERRKSAPAPVFALTQADIENFPRSADKYLEDVVGLRNHMVFLNGWARFHLGSPAPRNHFLVGDKSFVFRLSSKISEQYLGTRRYQKAKTIKTLFDNISTIDTLAQELSAEFFFTIAPNKITIYGADYAPDWYNAAITTKNTQILQFANHAKSRLPEKFINILEPLRRKKLIGTLYNHYGTHWNELGAYVAYQEIMKHFAKKNKSLKILRYPDIQVERRNSLDDTGNARNMGISGYLKNDYAYVTPIKQTGTKVKSLRPRGGTVGRERLNHYYGNLLCKDCPRLLVIGDSFSLSWHKLFPESFKEVLFIHHDLGRFDTEVIRKFNPDIILLEMVEQQLSRTFRKPKL